jgi:type IV secretion system protein VirD4
MRDRVTGPSEAVMLGAIASALALAFIVWLWGGVAGALFGQGWPSVGSTQLPSIVARLPARLSDPSHAWPGAVRADLPGPWGFYAALALVASGIALPGFFLTRARSLQRPAPGASWARRGDLRALHGRRLARHKSRLALGRHHGRLLRAEDRHALVAFGPPQSGKSSGLAIPALLEWEGPVVASSIKTDLLVATLTRRRSLGDVFVFDPFELGRAESHTWSPLHGARTWDGALEVAWRLAAAGELDHRGVDGGDFWALAAEQRLAPLLYTAAATGAGMGAVVRWVYGQGGRELDRTLLELSGSAREQADRDGAHAAYDAIRAFESQADRTRASIEATAQALLRAYRFTRVARSARSCEITADRLLEQSGTLYVIGDAKTSKLLRPIFLALLADIVDRAYERATLSGGRLELPLLLCLDEAGNVAPLPNLAEIASTAPSHNIQLVSIFHDLAQARSRYRQQAETVVNSHRARMLLGGVADLNTLRYFAGLTGEEEAPDRSYTSGSGGSTRSVARRRRPLIAPEALRQLRAGHALLLYGRMPPVQVGLRLWFKDRRLRRLVGRP